MSRKIKAKLINTDQYVYSNEITLNKIYELFNIENNCGSWFCDFIDDKGDVLFACLDRFILLEEEHRINYNKKLKDIIDNE